MLDTTLMALPYSLEGERYNGRQDTLLCTKALSHSLRLAGSHPPIVGDNGTGVLVHTRHRALDVGTFAPTFFILEAFGAGFHACVQALPHTLVGSQASLKAPKSNEHQPSGRCDWNDVTLTIDRTGLSLPLSVDNRQRKESL